MEAVSRGDERSAAELSDEAVAARVRDGDTALFEILMRRYNQRLYRVARSILRDDDEAEDVMQQAYVNAFMHLGQFEARAKFSTWLTRIAVYEALSRARRRARLTTAPVARPAGSDESEDTMDALQTTTPGPEQLAFAGELQGLLEGCIEALPDGYRSVFVLREIEGLTTGETAECLDLRQEAVKTRLHRAKALLRRGLYARAGVAGASAFQFHLSRCDRVVTAVMARIGRGPARAAASACFTAAKSTSP